MQCFVKTGLSDSFLLWHMFYAVDSIKYLLLLNNIFRQCLLYNNLIFNDRAAGN